MNTVYSLMHLSSILRKKAPFILKFYLENVLWRSGYKYRQRGKGGDAGSSVKLSRDFSINYCLRLIVGCSDVAGKGTGRSLSPCDPLAICFGDELWRCFA